MKIYLAGAFGIKSILQYNLEKSKPSRTFAAYFPFWSELPEAQLLPAVGNIPDPEGILLVINLNKKVWDFIQPRISQYKKKILIQFEAKIVYELANEKAFEFDHFISFDRTQNSHPGFHQMFIPYNPHLASSHLDKRGVKALINQWRSSPRTFIDAYLFRAFPRKKKSALIATLYPAPNYSIRKVIVDKWPNEIDVFGNGWQKSMPNYRGLVSSKVDILRRYRYCLVMENLRRTGYITEKLLDCFPSQTVPIYYGAPDIHDYPGLEWVPVIEDEQADIGGIIRNDDLYIAARKEIISNRKKVYDLFSTERFISMVCDVIRECSKDNL